MAADDEKTTIEVSEEAADDAGKKGTSKLILFGGIGVGVVVIGVVLALFVLKPMMAGSDSGDETELVENSDQADDEKAPKPKPKPKKKRKKKSGGHGDEEAGSLVFVIKDIVVNPAGTGGTRFLSVSFGFELGSAYAASEFRDRELMVRDALITILSSKTVAQLTDAKQKEIVRYQIKKRLEKLLDTDEINGVYYTDFVLQ